jgi:selenocysteine lyase/cysteine desulfurase
MMNIDQIRKDTKGCADKIFLNSAGASLVPSIVTSEMINYLKKEEELGGYETANLMSSEIEEFYTETAKLLKGKPENIAYTTNATDSFSRALSSIPFTESDYILTTNDDYISNQIAFIAYQKRFGVKILRSGNLPNGDIDLEDFERLMKKHQPQLVAITHIPTNSGLVQQAEAVGALCKKYDTWYLLDACQSVGQIPVDVTKIGCDFLSVTGRKFLRGPRGTGFLYISDKVIEKRLEPLGIDMRGANWTEFNAYEIQMNAKRFETWENSYASLIGLKEAVKYANGIGIETIKNYNKDLAQKLREKLVQIPKVNVLDKGSELSSIVTFYSEGTKLSELEKTLKENTIFYSVSKKSSALIDFSKKEVNWAIRLSPHYFNTAEEINETAEIISNLK